MNPEKTTTQEVENKFNQYFKDIIEEIGRLKNLVETAKTNLKRDYYNKKIDKLRSKMGKVLLDKAVLNPSLLKKTEDSNDE